MSLSKNIFVALITISVAVSLSACHEKNAAKTTAEWQAYYSEHSSEALSDFEKCRKGEISDTDRCQVAMLDVQFGGHKARKSTFSSTGSIKP